MSTVDNRSLIGTGIDEAVYLKRSPAAEGFMAGLKAALMAAPVGAAVQAARGKDAITGAIVGGIGAGVIAALAKGSTRKLENLDTEAELRYHAANIKGREPYFFLPPRQQMGRYFSRRYD